ncbi:MAG TPA: hypothetical protein VH092_14140, partial [Urbifossiella sp.]|nr:hypothetical protein [Urbifossiella sp.]
MHRFRAWGLAALAAAAGATAAGASDPPPRAARPGAPPSTVYDVLFGKSKAKADPVPADPGKAAPSAPALPPDVRAAALRDEQDAWVRRMAVCTKLREVAEARNDEALLRQVDDLERQAKALYDARTAALGIPKARPAEVLDRELGTGVAVSPLTAPA